MDSEILCRIDSVSSTVVDRLETAEPGRLTAAAVVAVPEETRALFLPVRAVASRETARLEVRLLVAEDLSPLFFGAFEEVAEAAGFIYDEKKRVALR